jgi:hypothetical protein
VRKRITSHQLVEIRTVLSRARTALERIDWITKTIAEGDSFYLREGKHSEEEISLMRSALKAAVDALELAELTTGYRELK